MSLELEFRLRAERTPNPQSIKWVVQPPLATGGRSAQFRDAPDPAVSPLAAALFAIPGIAEVFVVAEFVTLTKRHEVDWPDLAEPVATVLKTWVHAGREVFGPAMSSEERGEAGGDTARILEILDRDLRPLVARDGGEILFVDYRDGVVRLALQGACSGCPNSTQTLKFGIEERLKAAIPEIREVVAL